MSISYQDLNPIDSTVMINDKKLTLKKFSLLAQCWAHEEFATKDEPNGIKNLSEIIQDWTQPEPVIKLSWYLLKEKSEFRDFDHYLEFIDSKNSKWNNVKNIFESVVKTIGVSQPQIDEIEEDLELKKSLAAESLKTKPVTRSYSTFLPHVIAGLLIIFTALLLGKYFI